jgi:excisionase family DNA binding protein
MSSTLSVCDLCQRYSVSEHTVLSWIRSGELRAVNVGRKPGSKKPRWRISEEALAAFEQSRTPTPPPPRAQRRKRPAGVIKFY